MMRVSMLRILSGAFALRVKAHVARCPSSDYTTAVADWIKTQADYSKLFRRHRCKRTM